MTTTEIISNWLAETRTALQKNYFEMGLDASGQWAKSLQEFQSQDKSLIKLGITGEKYTGALEYGRRPNANQSDEAIKNWVGWAGSTFLKQWTKDKGITEGVSYAIAYKIAREGWQVPNTHNRGGLVSNVMTKERYYDLMKPLTLHYIEEIKTDMINTLAANGNN